MERYSRGLIIGRFQPFHKGHLHLLKRSLHYVNKLIIAIGSANRVDKDNPWTIEFRKNTLEKVLEKESRTFNQRVSKIVAIDDYLEDDILWLRKAIAKVGTFDIVIGNDEWTDGIFEKAGYKVLRVGFYKRNLYEGTKIRGLINKSLSWEDRVPVYLQKILKD